MKQLLDTKIQVTCSQCGQQSTQSMRGLQANANPPATCPHCRARLKEITSTGQALKSIDKALANFNRKR